MDVKDFRSKCANCVPLIKTETCTEHGLRNGNVPPTPSQLRFATFSKVRRKRGLAGRSPRRANYSTSRLRLAIDSFLPKHARRPRRRLPEAASEPHRRFHREEGKGGVSKQEGKTRAKDVSPVFVRE